MTSSLTRLAPCLFCLCSLGSASLGFYPLDPQSPYSLATVPQSCHSPYPQPTVLSCSPYLFLHTHSPLAPAGAPLLSSLCPCLVLAPCMGCILCSHPCLVSCDGCFLFWFSCMLVVLVCAQLRCSPQLRPPLHVLLVFALFVLLVFALLDSALGDFTLVVSHSPSVREFAFSHLCSLLFL